MPLIQVNFHLGLELTEVLRSSKPLWQQVFHPRSTNTHDTLGMRIVTRGCQFAPKIRIRRALRAPFRTVKKHSVCITSRRLASKMHVLSENPHDPLCIICPLCIFSIFSVRKLQHPSNSASRVRELVHPIRMQVGITRGGDLVRLP